MRHASDSSSGARLRAPLDSTSAAAAVMAQGKLSSEAGMAAAHNAALQAKQRARQQHQEELCDAALTPPQQRTQEQVRGDWTALPAAETCINQHLVFALSQAAG